MAEAELKRFLYLCTEEPRFISGDSELHGCYKKDKLSSISNMFYDEKNNRDAKDVLNNILQSVNSQNLLPKRDTLFFVLAIATRLPNINPDIRHDLYTLVLNLVKNNEDLFTFIKFYSKEKRLFPTGVNNLISCYYLRQDSIDLSRCLVSGNSYHGWTHKDLIKLSHCKTEDIVKEVILTYVLYGLEKAKEKANDNKEAARILEYFHKVKEYRSCNDENKVAQLIPDLNVKHFHQIPTNLTKSQLVWEALIPRMPLNELINSLPKLYKMGYLKPCSVHSKIVEVLSEGDASQIHPVEVLIGIRNFEKGGKPKDPHLIKYLENKEISDGKTSDPDYKKPDFAHQEPTKCPTVICALHKTLYASYRNLQPTAKRIMVTVDVSSKMNEPCLTSKNVSCLDAAALLTLCLFKADKQVTVAVFNGSKVTPVQLEKNASLSQTVKKLKEAKNDYVLWTSVFEYAMKNKKMFDVFINLCMRPVMGELSSEDKKKEKPEVAFANYRKRMNSQARLITCCLGIHNLGMADGSPYMLDVCGFDKNVPKVIEAFCKGLF